MFSGIIQARGRVISRVEKAGLVQFQVEAPDLSVEQKAIGNSIAVNGCCVTVTSHVDNLFSMDCGVETLRKTNLGELQLGDEVNLEPAMTLQTALHGHLVAGHVDDKGRVLDIAHVGESILLTVEIPAHLMCYMAPKGSVTLNGVSLTVAEVKPHAIVVMIIPHTWQVTNLNSLKVGAHLNVEADMIARYLARLIEARGE